MCDSFNCVIFMTHLTAKHIYLRVRINTELNLNAVCIFSVVVASMKEAQEKLTGDLFKTSQLEHNEL